MRFRLVPKSTTLGNLERPLRTLFQNTCVFRRIFCVDYLKTTALNIITVDPHCQQQKCSTWTLVADDIIKVCADNRGVLKFLRKVSLIYV